LPIDKADHVARMLLTVAHKQEFPWHREREFSELCECIPYVRDLDSLLIALASFHDRPREGTPIPAALFLHVRYPKLNAKQINKYLTDSVIVAFQRGALLSWNASGLITTAYLLQVIAVPILVLSIGIFCVALTLPFSQVPWRRRRYHLRQTPSAASLVAIIVGMGLMMSFGGRPFATDYVFPAGIFVTAFAYALGGFALSAEGGFYFFGAFLTIRKTRIAAAIWSGVLVGMWLLHSFRPYTASRFLFLTGGLGAAFLGSNLLMLITLYRHWLSVNASQSSAEKRFSAFRM
jgi:hypothetical protein